MNTETNTEISDKDFVKYKTLAELNESLEILRKMDLSSKSQEEIEVTFFSFFEVLPSLIAMYEPKKFNEHYFYRTRLNPNLNIEDLNLLRTYSYPLPQFCKENGRGNLKHKSVFYCSNCAMTSILESKPKAGDIGYLSIWSGNTTKDIKTGVLLPKDLKSENVWRALSDDLFIHVDQMLQEKTREKLAFFQEELKFIAHLFLEEKPPYPLTSWIANHLLYGTAWKDMIIYPSFVNESYSCNLAIHPNVADCCLKFEKVIRFKVVEITDKKYTLSTGNVGELVNNNMQWRKATEEELNFSMFPYIVEKNESPT